MSELKETMQEEVVLEYCIHNTRGWNVILVEIAGALFFLYCLLYTLELLENSVKVLGDCLANGLLNDKTNP